MGLFRESCSHFWHILPFYLIIFNIQWVEAQSVCTVRVAEEPNVASALSKPAKAEQISIAGQIAWEQPEKAMASDNAYASLNLKGQFYSTTLKLSQFGFNLPQGAIVRGIRVNLEGRRSGNGVLKEFGVRLVSGTNTSVNMAGKGFNALNVWPKSATDKKWSYGYDDQLWGINWNAGMINSPDFALVIDLINFSKESVQADLDAVSIEVFYEPLPTFCLTDVFSVYVDQRPDGCKYMWQVPQGFEWTSKSTNHYIVDFKASYAQPGVYPFCVDIYGFDNEYLSTCCRNIRIRNCTPSTLGNFVWNDINYNGLQDNGEPGIKDVKVQLYTAANTLVQTVTTGANGQYQFSNITEGSYYVNVEVPADYLTTLANGSDAASNSDFAANTHQSDIFFLPFGSNKTDLDFGLVKKLKLGDFVWEDLNYNGIQDVNEPGLGGVDVKLFNGSGTLLRQTTTDNAGKYVFDNLPAAVYELEFGTPAAYIPTRFQQGNVSGDSDIKSNKRTGLLNLQNIASQNNIDAGFYRFTSLGDFVWNDKNLDGKQNTAEAGTPGLKLYLLNSVGNVIDSTVTNALGYYNFDSLTPGTYKVRVILPPFTQPTLTSASSGGSKLEEVNGLFISREVTLISNQIYDQLDLGYIDVNSTIGGIVFRDFNNNGIKDSNEPGVPAISVSLLDASLQLIKSVSSNASGNYHFANLAQGGYFVSFTIEDSLQYTDPDLATDDIDSDVLNRFDIGFTDLISLGTADTLSNVYAGVCRRSVIGNRVWEDSDYNGIQDIGENGVPNVKVILTDDAGNEIEQTQTSIDGSYQFQKIITGTYQVWFEIPPFYKASRSGIGSPINDSDIDNDGKVNPVVVSLGVDRTDVDAGLVKVLSAGDRVWEDLNYNGLQDNGEPGIENVEVIVKDAFGNDIAQTVTGPNGQYVFNNLPSIDLSFKFEIPTGYLATRIVALPANANSDINSAGETGLLNLAGLSSISDIDAGFYRAACIGDFIWLDDNGDGVQDASDAGLNNVMVILYDDQDNQLEVLVSDSTGHYQICGLKPGTYYLTANPEAGYFPTTNGLGSQLLDLGVGEFRTPNFTVVSGDVNDQLDLGLVYRPEANLCGKVFEDADADGRLAAGEKGVEGVRVELVDEDFNPVAEAVSGSEGLYCFSDLLPGNYYIRFYIGDSIQFTDANVGTDDADSDAEGAVDLGVTPVITMLPATDVNNVYAGITRRTTISGFTWFDFTKDGVIGSTEPGIPGLSVELMNDQGAVLASTTTAANPVGTYSFDKVPRGNYQLRFQTNPNFEFTLKGVDPLLGSIANPDGTSDVFVALPNKNFTHANAGYALIGGSIEGKVWLDVNKNKEQDTADDVVPLSQVRLYDAAGQLVKFTQTDLSGHYSFFKLDPGLYYVVFDTLAIHSYIQADALYLESDVNHENGRGSTRLISVVNGSIQAGIDAGVYDIRSSISGLVYEDRNGNGIFGESDTLWPGLTIRLLSDGAVVATAQSDAEGRYVFDALMPGNYIVEFVQNDSLYTTAIYQYPGADTLLDSDVLLTGLTDTFTLVPCTMVGGVNAGYRGFGKVEGEGFVDENENGLDDDNVDPLNDIQVCLIDVFNQIVAVDTTREIGGLAGRYAFEGIPAGSYRLKVRRPLFYIFTLQNVGSGSQEDIDSDVLLTANTFAYSGSFLVEKDGTVDDQDFGLVFRTPAISSIRGQVWKETNVDGIRTTGEAAVEAVTMTLFKADGTQVAQTATDASGLYFFDMLIEGFYYIKAGLKPGETYTFYKEGADPTIDSDFSSQYKDDATLLFYLGISADTMHVDLGITEELVFGDFVWDDLNDNGKQDPQEPGIKNVNVSVVRADGKTIQKATTDNAGQYGIKRVPAGNYRLVFEKPDGYSAARKQAAGSAIDSDINEDSRTDLSTFPAPAVRNDIDAGFVKNGSIGDFVWIDFNANGIQNAGEPGKDSVVINLYNDAGSLVATTQSFTDMGTGVQGRYIFEDVRPGTYFVEFKIPSGYKAVPTDIGDDETDSDIDNIGVVFFINVVPGGHITHVDAGIFSPGCIGNRVWIDADKNGIQDSGEEGLPAAEVRLYRSNGSLVATGTTNEDGFYQFNDLAQGLYYTEFVVDPIYEFTIPDQGDETTDSDADATGTTPLISLAHGAKFYDLDAGVYLKTTVSPENPEVREEAQNYELTILPNPANFETNVSTALEGTNVWLMDASGRIICRWISGKQPQRVDLRNLEAGIYYVSYETEHGTTTRQLVKVD